MPARLNNLTFIETASARLLVPSVVDDLALRFQTVLGIALEHLTSPQAVYFAKPRLPPGFEVDAVRSLPRLD
jgi:hypothetical protein